MSFFANRPLVLDLTNVAPTKAEALEIIAFIEERNLRLIAVEGVDADWVPPRLAPLPGAGSVGRHVRSEGGGKAFAAPNHHGSPRLPLARPARHC